MPDRAAALEAAVNQLVKATNNYAIALSRYCSCRARRQRLKGETPKTGDCRLVICDACQDLRWDGERDVLNARLIRALQEAPPRRVISLTFTSPNVTISEAELLTDQRLRGWARFSERKAFRSIAYGHARSICLRVEAEANTVWCNTNAIVIAERIHTLQTADEWMTAWKSIPDCDGDDITHFNMIDVEQKHDVASFNADLSREIARVTRIGLKPTELCEMNETQTACDPSKLAQVFRALRGRKLIRSGLALARAGP